MFFKSKNKFTLRTGVCVCVCVCVCVNWPSVENVVTPSVMVANLVVVTPLVVVPNPVVVTHW